jgi:cytochrome c-type biogenesis protein CcmF
MIAELGHFALILALAVALAQGVALLWGSRAGLARPAAALSFLLLNLSFAALLYLYAVSDFSVAHVAANSQIMMPLGYRIAAAWGNPDGALLMWGWMLSLWAAVLAWRGDPALRGRALGAQGLIICGILLLVLFSADPFLRLDPAAAEGAGLAPVLRDPAFALHPPLLQMGTAGFSIVFCLAVAALLEGRTGRAFAQAAQPWARTAWAFLTAGICAGAVWAFGAPGWGGFWIWDPAQNAALMPWLCGAALLHALALLNKRDAPQGWATLLALLPFSFALLGLFLARSDILPSLHAFGGGRGGIFFLALLVAVAGGAFALYAAKAPRARPDAPFAAFSRETALLLNNAVLCAMCAAVCMGTLYPAFMRALGLAPVSVGEPYYLQAILPMIPPLALLMGAAPYLGWQRGGAKSALKNLMLPLVLAALPVGLPFALHAGVRPSALLGVGLAGWVLWATMWDLVRKGVIGQTASYYGMVAAHLGFAAFLFGATLAAQGAQEKVLWMNPGDRADIAGREIVYLHSEEALGPDYNAARARFRVTGPGGTFLLAPERRWHPAMQRETGVSALHAGLDGVLSLTLGSEDRATGRPGRRVVHAAFYPFALLVLGGGVLMALGGAIAALGRKREARDE